MGGCVSSPSFHVSTAKLILHDGTLQEFAEAVKVAQVLRDTAGFFVCDSDDIAFDEYIFPLSAEDKLHLDHLYFLLPNTKLQRRLEASEMVKLAVKARAAMQRNRSKHHKYGCKIVPVMEDTTIRHRSHKSSGMEEWREEVQFSNTTINSASAEKLMRVASRNAIAARKVWRTKLPTIPEAFAY